MAGQTEDAQAIRQVQVQQADTWNRHDAKAYAALFTQDGDVVNVVGWWWRGRGSVMPPIDSFNAPGKGSFCVGSGSKPVGSSR